MGNSEHMGRLRSLFRTSIGKRSGLFDRSKYEMKPNVKIYLLCEEVHWI